MEQRIRSYRRSLQKNPAYYNALCESLTKYQNCGLHTELYLHVFAPVMTAYVEWVLKEAKASGKQRLYFLARDGWQMYLTAQKLAEARGIPIDIRYLRISRYALRIPSYHLMGRTCVEQICLDGMNVTFETLSKRAALTEEETNVLSRMLGYEERRRERLTRTELISLKERLSDTPFFLDCVDAHSRKAYGETMRYLAQEGLLEDIPYALVDSGWTGTMQQTLSLLLSQKKPGIRLCGYYFGLYELPGKSHEGYHAFYFSPGSGLKRKAYFSNCLFECVFSEPVGMTTGYTGRGDCIRPVTGGKQNPNGTRLIQNAAALQCYVHAYCIQIKQNRTSDADKTPFVEELLTRLMGKPVRKEAECYGAYLFSDDVLEERLKRVGEPFSEKELRSQNFVRKMASKLGMTGEKTAERGWAEGSVAAGGRQVRRYLRHVRCYKYFVYIRKSWKDWFR